MTAQQSNNNIRPLIRWELVATIIQFLVLLAGLIFSYASTWNRLNAVEDKLNQHLQQHSVYLRTDLWENRNRFIDQKLDRIEQKVDQLVAHDIERMRSIK